MKLKKFSHFLAYLSIPFLCTLCMFYAFNFHIVMCMNCACSCVCSTCIQYRAACISSSIIYGIWIRILSMVTACFLMVGSTA